MREITGRRITKLYQARILLIWCLVANVVGGSVRAEEAHCVEMELKGIHDLLAEAYLNIQLVDYNKALSTLDTIEKTLPCTPEIVPAQVLGTMFTYRGLAQFYLGNKSAAENAFLKAQVVYPDAKWLPEFGQRPRETFLDARERKLRLPLVNIPCPLLKPGVEVYYDGREMTQGAGIPSMPGSHLVQLNRGDNRWSGFFFDLEGDMARDLPLPVDVILPDPARQHLSANDMVAQQPAGQTDGTDSSGPHSGRRHSSKSGLVPVYVSAGTGALALGAAGVFGAMYWSTRQELMTGPYYTDVEDPDKEALLTKNKNAAILTDVSLVVATASAGSAVIFHMLNAKNTGSESRREPRGFLAPYLARSGAGLVLHGSFY